MELPSGSVGFSRVRGTTVASSHGALRLSTARPKLFPHPVVQAAMSGPYRSRLVHPENHDEFWAAVERRAKALRRAPKLVALLAVLPAVAIIASASLARAGDAFTSHTLQRVVASPFDEPFGLFVSASGANARRGPQPPA